MSETGSEVRDLLCEGFELGVVDWGAIEPLTGLLVGDKRAVLTAVDAHKNGAWVWLDGVRFFISCPGAPAPPVGAELVSVEPIGASVTFRFRKKKKDFFWVGDAIREYVPSRL